MMMMMIISSEASEGGVGGQWVCARVFESLISEGLCVI